MIPGARNALGVLQVSSALPGAGTSYIGGFALTPVGEVLVHVSDLPTRFANGFGFNTAGQLCVAPGGTIFNFVCGLPFTQTGRLVVQNNQSPASNEPYVGGVRVGPLGGVYITGVGEFSPINLFQSGEVGAWYDPSDLSTMFQDSAGTTPVTADGQPVGLILDKSKGLVLGSNVVTNGDFSNGSTGWTVPANWTIGSGVATSLGTGGAYLNTGQITVSGKTYQIEFDIVSETVATGGVSVGVGVSSAGPVFTGVGHKKHIITATANSYVFVGCRGAGTWQGSIDNISVRELLGNHVSQATAASRPLYKVTGLCKWNDFDAVDDVLNTTFQSALGSSCTVARGNVGAAPTILTGQTIGTSYANSTDNCGLIIVNRALTGQETADLTAWLTAKGATS